MSAAPAGPDRGAGGLRRWTVQRSGDELRLDVWTPPTRKLLLLGACALVVAPAVLMWTKRPGISVVEWLVALLYPAVAAIAVYLAARGAGRERVRVLRRQIVVERFDVFRWHLRSLEIAGGANVSLRDGRTAGVGDALLVWTEQRAITFGRWLPRGEAERVADALRELIAPPDAERARPDGVVRRVPRLWGPATIEGAAGIVVLEHHPASVGSGTLSWRQAPVGALSAVIALLLGWSALSGTALMAATSFSGMSSLRVVMPVILLLAAAGVAWRRLVLPVLLRLRSRRRARAHPGEPWRVVSAWDTQVLALAPWRRIGPALVAVLVIAGINAAVVVRATAGTWQPVWGAFGALLGLVVLGCLYRIQNVLFLGQTEVRLRSIPSRVPGEVVLDFSVSPRGGTFETISFELLRLVQVPLSGSPPKVGYSHHARYVLPDDQPPPGPGEQVTARFTVPAGVGASGTDLERGRPVFWEILVEGTTSCGWYSESFPIPIYDEPT